MPSDSQASECECASHGLPPAYHSPARSTLSPSPSGSPLFLGRFSFSIWLGWLGGGQGRLLGPTLSIPLPQKRRRRFYQTSIHSLPGREPSLNPVCVQPQPCPVSLHKVGRGEPNSTCPQSHSSQRPSGDRRSCILTSGAVFMFSGPMHRPLGIKC